MRRIHSPAALAGLAALAAVAVAVGMPAAGGSANGGHPRYEVARYGLSVPVPPGWHPSSARLVPKLLAPREVVSLGNFGMRVGGGGNCGREPSASISRMRPGDALVSIQEVPVFAGLRAHLRHSFPPLPRDLGFADLRRVPDPGAGPGDVRGATLAFSEAGRAFEALVYVSGPPTPVLRADVGAVLAGLRVRPGRWDRFHGDELPAT